MTTTLYTVAPVTKFSAAGYDIVQAGTVVPDGVVPAIQSAAFGANVTINTSAGGAPQLVQVPSYYNGGTGAPVGDVLPVGSEVRDSTGASWEKKSDGTWVAVSGGSGGAVASVAGKTGAVTLVKGDVGLGNVDNTSDTAKPVSTAQAAADALSLAKASNLSDLASAATARTNLGLGTAATQATSAFDAAGAAAATLPTPTAVKTGAYTATAGDFVPVDTTSAAVTITLPAAPVDKTVIGVKHVIQGGTNAVTIARGGSSDVFNKAGGSTSLTLPTVNQTMVLQYAASTGIWYVRDSLSLAALDARYVPTEVAQAVTASTATTPITIASGSIVNLALNANTTLALSTPSTGQNFTMVATQGGTNTLAFGTNVKWPGGTAPAASSGAGKVDVFTFIPQGDGTNWLGFVGGKAFA